MKLWVDADACPAPIKELIIRAARRLRIFTVFVANKFIGVPESSYISSRRIGMDPEAVDRHIIENAQEGDFVVTQDIPLAAALVPKGVIVISTRGELFNMDNIGERLSIRNFLQDAREAGITTSGPSAFTSKDKQRFSDTLDRELTRSIRRESS